MGEEENEVETTGLYEMGKRFVKLGEAMMNKRTRISELATLANACGVDIEFRVVKKEPGDEG